MSPRPNPGAVPDSVLAVVDSAELRIREDLKDDRKENADHRASVRVRFERVEENVAEILLEQTKRGAQLDRVDSTVMGVSNKVDTLVELAQHGRGVAWLARGLLALVGLGGLGAFVRFIVTGRIAP